MAITRKGLEIFEAYRSSIYRLEDAVSSLIQNPNLIISRSEEFSKAVDEFKNYVITQDIKKGHPEFLSYEEVLLDCAPKLKTIEVKFLIKKAILPKAYFSSKKP